MPLCFLGYFTLHVSLSGPVNLKLSISKSLLMFFLVLWLLDLENNSAQQELPEAAENIHVLPKRH